MSVNWSWSEGWVQVVIIGDKNEIRDLGVDQHRDVIREWKLDIEGIDGMQGPADEETEFRPKRPLCLHELCVAVDATPDSYDSVLSFPTQLQQPHYAFRNQRLQDGVIGPRELAN
jgi:hypothetical protein